MMKCSFNLCDAELRPRSLKPLAIGVGLAIAMAGCAAPSPGAPGKPWTIAPSYRITHTGPGADQGYMALARQYEVDLRWREARNAWRKAALEAPQDADVLNGLGMAEARWGQHADAVAVLRRAVAAAPDRGSLRNNLGYALLLHGQDDEAVTVLRSALERDPSNRLARANLDRIDLLAGVSSSTRKNPANGAITARSFQTVVAVRVQTTPNLAPLQVAQLLPPRPSLPSPPPLLPLQLRQSDTMVATLAPLPDDHAAAEPRFDRPNGNGNVGTAGRLRTWLSPHGVTGGVVLTNRLPHDTATTSVHYRAGFVAAAQGVDDGMPQPVNIALTLDGALDADVKLPLGGDQI